jgi:glutamine synthetase
MRSAMCLVLEEMGQTTEVHHHEVATAGQCELGVRFKSCSESTGGTGK